MMVAGLNSLAILLAPYSAYGRIASSLFAPVWQWGNNLLAYFAERMDSYAFYEVDVWMKEPFNTDYCRCHSHCPFHSGVA